MDGISLHILQVNTYDVAGGAERIACDLFRYYRFLGHQSWLAVGGKKTDTIEVFLIPNRSKKISTTIHSKIKNLPGHGYLINQIEHLTNPSQTLSHIIGREYYNYPGTWDILKITPKKPDILHCHNLHKDYFDLRALSAISQEIPTVLTLHDIWLLTGHCAHSFDCERWKTGCGNCPDLSIYPSIRRDETVFNWNEKSKIFRNCRLNVVTPSQWLMNLVNQSMLKPGIVASKVIPNGVDLTVFHPADKLKVREYLGLPLNSKILLFAANGIRENAWKDYQTLKKTIARLATSELDILCIALGEKAQSEMINGIEIRFIPFQDNPNDVARYYQAANIYIHPARAEVWGLTITEAFSCGIPVIASDVGGIPEQITEGKTGFLVPVGDFHTMAERILLLLSDDELQLKMGFFAADIAKQKFGLERMGNEYIHFYQAVSHDFYHSNAKKIT